MAKDEAFFHDMDREGMKRADREEKEACDFEPGTADRKKRPFGKDEDVAWVIRRLFAEPGNCILKMFLPLVLKYAALCAKVYGLPFADMFQVGCMAVVKTGQAGDGAEWRARQMKQRVPQEIVRAARTHMHEGGEVELEVYEMLIPDHESGLRTRRLELELVMRLLLTAEEFLFAVSVIDGETQSEYARRNGISQATVSRRLETVRGKLRSYFLSVA